MTGAMDEDALIAAVDLIGRSGGKRFEFGYLDEDVPVERARWWAHADYGGTRISEENHRGPLEAIEALARRVLTGGMCTHCRGLIALSDAGALVTPGARMLDGSVMTEDRARGMGQCRWTRVGKKWVRGCDTTADTTAAPGRARPVRRERRAAQRRRG